MSRRRRSQPKTVAKSDRKVKTLLNYKNLAEVQERNFRFIFQLSDDFANINGVKVIECLSYELSQMINDAYIRYAASLAEGKEQ